MEENLNKEIMSYVEVNIENFHAKRLESLQKLRLSVILKRKNPYLFKAKNILSAESLIETFLKAHLSSQEEAIFGDFLEGLAIFINQKIFNGSKSSTEGMDLEFTNSGQRYIVSIKSGPNWGNSRQLNKLKDDFRKAKKILRTSNSNVHVIAVNGCCYGRDSNPDKGDYFKYCGEDFWTLVSGDKNLYIELVEPLGYNAKYKNEEFEKKYAQILNQFTFQFIRYFCNNGVIDWEKLVRFNSSNIKPEPEFVRMLDNYIE